MLEANHNMIEEATIRLYELEDNIIDMCEYLIQLRDKLSGSDKTEIRRLSSKLEKIQILLSNSIDEFEHSSASQNRDAS